MVNHNGDNGGRPRFGNGVIYCGMICLTLILITLISTFGH